VDESAVVRIDVPAKGQGEGTGQMRAELEGVVPVLQSGSLFGGKQGLELVGAEQLLVGEAEVITELLERIDEESMAVAVVAFGSLPRPLQSALGRGGEKVAVRKMWERQAGEWLAEEIRRRGLVVDDDAVAALVQRFGSDVAALGQALDQLEEHRGKVTRTLVLDRFRNRPDEPLVHYLDAIGAGNVGQALRRLTDFLTHGHPLVLLAAVEGDLRRRALAGVAPDLVTLTTWTAGKSGDRRLERAWRDRGKINDSSLRRALDAVVRADRILKTQPEDVHLVTMERLTVALCRWYGARRR
jgi:DNA polymerase III delta subunit